jgi:hypothetical protein
VRYAERQVRGGAIPGATPVPVNGSSNGSSNGSANGAATGSAAVPEAPSRTTAAASAGRPLSRRQPGATIDDQAVSTERQTSDQPLDPEAARDLVQQFESGVARAMRQISAGLRDEEGTR